MLFLFFISSGLFLGWSLGANDAANVFGTAVGSGMIKFTKAALVAGIFVILGATIQGTGTTKTLSQLGSINALGGAFTVALCSALVVTWMTMKNLPVSTSQAIVGAIIGWCYFTSNPVDYSVLTVIVTSWITGPILGALFSALLYVLMRLYIRKTKTHAIKLDMNIRYGLLIAGAFGAYSLGANNIANVMGVFVHAAHFSINLGFFNIQSTQVLFLLGGLSIAVGILTYGKKVMNTIGGGILEITPESAIVVVLSQSLVLFVFSSTALSNLVVRFGLPAIPLVPVSSTQVIVGALIGIGAIKGVQEIRFRLLGHIMLGWLLTPVLAGVFTFFSLFFISNVFKVTISTAPDPVNQEFLPDSIPTVFLLPKNSMLYLLLLMALLFLLLAISAFIRYNKKKTAGKLKAEPWNEQLEYARLQKYLTDTELKIDANEQEPFENKLELRRKQLIAYASNIIEQRRYLGSLCLSLEKINLETDLQKKNEQLLFQIKAIKQKMCFTAEMEQIYQKAEELHAAFPSRLVKVSPLLTEQDKRLALLLRLGFSSKEIASLLIISPKSVDIARYRLRKKLDLKKEENLTQFINTI